MAELVGCLAMSHSPMLLTPPDKWDVIPDRIEAPAVRPELQRELTPEAKQAKWKRCNDAIEVLCQELDKFAPDTVVIIGDDQSENVMEDNMPPFTVFIGEEVEATLHFKYFGESPLAQRSRYRVDSALAQFLLDQLMEEGFDPAWAKKTRAQFGLGHAFGRALKFLMPDARYSIVPITVNTFYSPAPSAARCFQFGQALGSALRQHKDDLKVAVLGSGGLSHFRIDEELDRDFIKAIESYDTRYLSNMPSSVLTSGTSELRNWIVTEAAFGAPATMIDYVPCYRTLTGIGCAMGFAYWKH
ncbi:MAG TPA: hypothetical protein VNL14_11930 [Candidatus Acidoferrales bacterium]|nr:hypothetical protein [Candidatus Acidoferrales bacterium]